MATNLSGLKVEYAIALIYSSEAGKREATLGFDIGQGTQDLGFRAEVHVLFDVRPAVPLKLTIRDHDGKPTVGRFTFRDRAGHVYPPQARRLAPDLFFQEQIYRNDGDIVLLPPGEFTMSYSRGPEYRLLKKTLRVPARGEARAEVKLQRWIDPAAFGYFSGDHHIHAAGCAHYTNPTEGVMPRDMYLQVKGEGLNVGCLLTWGPCYDFQRQFFEPKPHKLSEPFTVLKYDLEVSGFGSQALGHVCLLNLRDQTYPGSGGTKDRGWPTWTTPVLCWAKGQGAFTGYAHSASGLHIDPAAASQRLLALRLADLERFDVGAKPGHAEVAPSTPPLRPSRGARAASRRRGACPSPTPCRGPPRPGAGPNPRPFSQERVCRPVRGRRAGCPAAVAAADRRLSRLPRSGDRGQRGPRARRGMEPVDA
jgi:hypothetical protein